MRGEGGQITLLMSYIVPPSALHKTHAVNTPGVCTTTEWLSYRHRQVTACGAICDLAKMLCNTISLHFYFLLLLQYNLVVRTV